MEQPNTINLHASKIFKIRPEVFIIDETQKAHRGSDEIFVGEEYDIKYK